MQMLMVNELVEHLDVNQAEQLELVVDSIEECSLSVDVKDHVQCELIVNVKNTPKLVLHVVCNAYSQVNLFIMNESNNSLELMNDAAVYEEGRLTLSYAEFNEASSSIQADVKLKEYGASCCMNSALLSRTEKTMKMQIHHQASSTSSLMNHSGVLLEGGKLYIDAIGKIDRGAKGSKSHQKSRALTFDQPKSATVLPQLLIDENDVEASHATSVGQIDENQMYYLQSRGLSKSQATQLITLGALMPIAEVLSDEAMKSQMRNKIEAKVNEVCSM